MHIQPSNESFMVSSIKKSSYIIKIKKKNFIMFKISFEQKKPSHFYFFDAENNQN